MLARCYACRKPFGGNTTLEEFPVARRVAYDPARGRLWAVCPVCRRWSLAPMEERWEALEALERLARDRGQLQGSTANISLLRAGELELVRVGRVVGLREESHWRYGREFAARRRQAELVEGVGEAIDTIGTGLVLVLTAILIWPVNPHFETDKWLRWARARRFGRHAWAGDAVCAVCGQPLPPARFEDRPALVLEPAGEGPPRLRRRCTACAGIAESGALLDAVTSRHVLGRLLAYQNYRGADAATVAQAVWLLGSAPSAASLLTTWPSRRLVLGRIPARMSFALEIALAEERERELLQLDVAALELRWREEEALAAIVDDELTPAPDATGRGARGTSPAR